jgi:hypothetical protein
MMTLQVHHLDAVYELANSYYNNFNQNGKVPAAVQVNYNHIGSCKF